MDALEILENAKYNFKNLEKEFPYIKSIPFYQIAMEQLTNGIKKLEEDS
jgi:hypothetical protein